MLKCLSHYQWQKGVNVKDFYSQLI